MRNLLVVGICVCIPTTAFGQGLKTARPKEVGMSSARLERIRPVMHTYIDEGKGPGMITAVARRGKVVHFERLGMMDVEAGKKMRPDSLFRIYSMTKPIASAAMLILYEQGRFRLNEPVSKYLPELQNLTVYLGGLDKNLRTEPAGQMTIKHLLLHTSGLIYGADEPGVSQLYRDAELWKAASLKEFVDKLAALPLVAQPGTEWNYGVSTDVLGRLIEVLSGKPFDEFLEERIFCHSEWWIRPSTCRTRRSTASRPITSPHRKAA